MTKRKYAVLSIFALSLAFTLLAQVTSSENVYNPLADVDQDGDVDVVDQRSQQLAMFTTGNPVNITDLEARVDTLNASLVELKNRLEALETGGFIGKPAYDNETQISTGQEKIFVHNLNTTDVLVFLMGRYDSASPYKHQIDYGGTCAEWDAWRGVYWKDLTAFTIRVVRHSDDANWNYVRVMMWKILP